MTDGKTWVIIGLSSAVLMTYLFPELCRKIQQVSRFQEGTLPKYDLVIGILSARDHFEHRQVIRETWMKDVNSAPGASMKAWFILGAHPCLVPPLDRVDPYSCQRWDVHLSGISENICALFPTFVHKPGGQVDTRKVKVSSLVSSLTFKVLHPIVLLRLGVYEDLLRDNHTVEVWLTDLHSQEEVVRVVYSTLDHGIAHQLYHYQTTEPFLLPKGFEGRVSMSCSCDIDEIEITGHVAELNTAGGVIHIDPEECLLSFDDCNNASMVTFMFSIHDKIGLEKHISSRDTRFDRWAERIRQESKKITAEIEEFGDIMLVDTIDSYRNLPAKLLHFHHRLQKQSHQYFVMKTDDDCVVNVRNVLQGLQLLNKTKVAKVWWSSFRDQWFVERHGKWKENTFTADVYPKFACGTGNVVSDDVSKWLAENVGHLHLFQGEDVSMGIWLSAIGVAYIEDSRWQCDDTCVATSLAISQLSPGDIRRMWTNQQTCGNFCYCDNKPSHSDSNL
ncbi:UDP-GalNAc:beta-1,3-N-acetylgalactosaminyltransferase 2-like [Liolophura sinensis]|uniref:UDP-GalNAc:beta-1, 3-N-acetylgalactosaminyltransferase 2-like n=1 Tax=Liolophura sinensis TaxID=3198878 RepID=UPI003158A0AC